MRILIFLLVFTFFGNAQVMEVVGVINKLYSLISGINSVVKFYAKITEECDSEYFHYEVRGTHFRSIFCSKIYPIRLQNTNLSQMASKFKT